MGSSIFYMIILFPEKFKCEKMERFGNTRERIHYICMLSYRYLKTVRFSSVLENEYYIRFIAMKEIRDIFI